MASDTSSSADCNDGAMVAERKSGTAADASASASGCGKDFGVTSTRRENPIVIMARAAAPMLPGWLGEQSTTRTRSRNVSIYGGINGKIRQTALLSYCR